MKKKSAPESTAKNALSHGKKSPQGSEHKGHPSEKASGKSLASKGAGKSAGVSSNPVGKLPASDQRGSRSVEGRNKTTDKSQLLDQRSSKSAATGSKAAAKSSTADKQISRSSGAKFVGVRNPRAAGRMGPSAGERATAAVVTSEEGTSAALQVRQTTAEQVVAMADYLRARRGFATDEEMAEILGVPRTRLLAWKQGAELPNPANSQMLSHLAVVVQELEEFLDLDVIPDWLLTEQHTLGGRTPVEALREGQLAEVLQTANATEHGAFI